MGDQESVLSGCCDGACCRISFVITCHSQRELSPDWVAAMFTETGLEQSPRNKGFYRTRISDEIIHEYAKSMNLSLGDIELDEEIIKSGYSQNVTQLISPDFKKFLEQLAEPLLRSSYVRKIVPFPRVIDVHCSVSVYNRDAVQNTTHAHLWHRDADDLGPQFKIFVPLTSCDELNGQFSCLSTEIAGWGDQLLDQTLVEKYSSLPDNDYRKSDASSRLTDRTLRSNVPSESILDFTSEVGDVLLVDTNSCYHKGGLVLTEGARRLMVQITVGSITHLWVRPPKGLPRLAYKVVRACRNAFGKSAKIRRERIPRLLSPS